MGITQEQPDIFDRLQELAKDESETTMTRARLSVYDDGSGNLELDVYDKTGNSQTINLFHFKSKEEFLEKVNETKDIDDNSTNSTTDND